MGESRTGVHREIRGKTGIRKGELGRSQEKVTLWRFKRQKANLFCHAVKRSDFNLGKYTKRHQGRNKTLQNPWRPELVEKIKRM